MAVHLSTHKEKEPDPSDLDSLALIIVRFLITKALPKSFCSALALWCYYTRINADVKQKMK